MTDNIILKDDRSGQKRIRSIAALALLGSLAVFGQGGVTKPGPAPRVIPPNVSQPARIVIFNKCPRKATFTISDTSNPSAPWIQWTNGNDIDVGGGSSASFRFAISTFSGIKPGTYQTTLSAECVNCVNCIAVTRTTFPVAFTVPGEEETPPKPEGGGIAGDPKPPTGNPPSETGPVLAGATNPKPPATNPLVENPASTNPTAPTNPAPVSDPPSVTNPAPPSTPNSVPTSGAGNSPAATNSSTPQATATDAVPPPPQPTSDTSPLAVTLAGLTFAAGLSGLLLGSGRPSPVRSPGPSPAAPVSNGNPGPQPVQQPVRTALAPPGANQPSVGAPPADQPKTPVSTPEPVLYGPDDPMGEWGASLAWSDTGQAPSVHASPTPPAAHQLVSVTPIAHAPDSLLGVWGASLAWPAQQAPVLNVATTYVDPDGLVHPMVPVQPGSEGPLPGSYGGRAMPVYPPGRDPRLYVNPRTGEQKWVQAFHLPPAGWVEKSPLVNGSGAEYVDAGSGQVRRGIPDNWVQLQPMQEFFVNPSTGQGKWVPPGEDPSEGWIRRRDDRTVTYLPGREPRIYVDPTTGQQRPVNSGEKPPDGWVPRTGLGALSVGEVPARGPQAGGANPAGGVVAQNVPQPPAAAPEPHTIERPGTGNPNAVPTADHGESKIQADEHGNVKNSPEGAAGLDQVRKEVGQIETGGTGDTTERVAPFPVSVFPPILSDGPGTPKPLTQEDVDRIAFIDGQVALAHQQSQAAKAQGLVELEKAYAEREKLWKEIKSLYGVLAKDFIQDLDELRQLNNLLDQAKKDGAGPTLIDGAARVLGYINERLPTKTLGTALLGLSDRDLDTYGLIASLQRSVEEHQYIISLWFSPGGAKAVNQYLQDEAKKSLYTGAVGLVAGGAQGGVGATQGAITSGTGVVFDTPLNYLGKGSKAPAKAGAAPSEPLPPGEEGVVAEPSSPLAEPAGPAAGGSKSSSPEAPQNVDSGRVQRAAEKTDVYTPAERASAAQPKAAAPKSEPPAKSMNDRPLGEVPIDPNGAPGTRLPPDHDPLFEDPNDPPIVTHPETGEPIPAHVDPETGNLVPDKPVAEGPKAAVKQGSNAQPAAVDPKGATQDVPPSERPWNKISVDPNQEPGTRLPPGGDQYAEDPHDPPILTHPVTGEPVPAHVDPETGALVPNKPIAGLSSPHTAAGPNPGPVKPGEANVDANSATSGSPHGGTTTLRLPPSEVPTPQSPNGRGGTLRLPQGEVPAKPGVQQPSRPGEVKPPRPLTPEEKAAWGQAVNEDVNKALTEDAERAARGEGPRIPKFRQLPREVQVPPGRESKGASPEELNSPVRKLTPEEQAAWAKSVEEDVNPALEKFSKGAAKQPKPMPLQDTKARAQQAETKTRIFPAVSEDSGNPPSANAPEQPAEPPSAAPNNRRARWQALQAARDVPEEAYRQYGGAVEQARKDAGGPGGACEAAKESLMKNPDTAGASHKTEWVGWGSKRFQHEIVISKEGYVLDPVARQAVDRGLTTWDTLQQRGLKSAVEKGIFTPEQWTRFKALG
jgi:hypothetical protein